MAGNICSYINCGRSRRLVPKLKMFRFPSDKTRAEKWVINSGNITLEKLEFNVLRNRQICEYHFSDEDFTNIIIKNRLKCSAVPKYYKRIPVNSERRNIWISLLGWQEDKRSTIYLYVCSDHFDPSDVITDRNGLKCLRTDANPLPCHSAFHFTSDSAQASTSGTQSFTESELPHADLSQMVVEVKPEAELTIVQIEPKLEDQEFDYDTTAHTLDDREFASVGDHTTSTQTAPGDAFCRLCLREADKERVISLSTLDGDKSEKCVQMIKSLMPNFDFSLVHDPLMCHMCTMRLELACQFVEETMESQKTIKAYRDQYAMNDQEVLCEDVIKFKSSPSDLCPPKKKKKLHSPQMESSLIYDYPHGDDVEGTNEQPLDIKEVEVKIDDEMFSAESDNFIRFETVTLENAEDTDEILTAIKSEPYEEDLDGPKPYNLTSNQHSNLQDISDLVSRTSNENLEGYRSVFITYSSGDYEES